VFEVNDWVKAERFLILGTEGGTYYATERKLTRASAGAIERCIAEDGIKLVNLVSRISNEGKAPKNDPAIFALALACCAQNLETRKAAFDAISVVCRTGTHLFTFLQNLKELRSFGAGIRAAVSAWYGGKDAEDLAFQVCKYQQRNGMSHRDVFRLIHPVATTPAHEALYRYIVTGGLESGGDRFVAGKPAINRVAREYGPVGDLPEFVYRFEELKQADEKRTIELIEKHGFTHEMIATHHKNSPAVWEALLQKMPLHACLRNLGKMTSVGLLKPLSSAAKLVSSKFDNAEYIRRSRMHPITILSAAKVYGQGHGDKGSLTWVPNQTIASALDAAFYKSFDFVEPTGKNFMLAIDISGSMGSPVSGAPGITCRDAAACLAMVTARTEPNYYFFGFSHNFVPLDINNRMTLHEVEHELSKRPFGSTDCSLPMVYAKKNKLDVDCFAVFTDSETYAGSIHPFQALKQYRGAMNKPRAREAVVGMTVNDFSIADPSDPLTMDFVGFSTDTPALLADFCRRD
jgi:60 kDa SS-A/Ro ribonucleoprotein